VPEFDLLRTGRSVGVLPEATSGVNNVLAIVLQRERLLFVVEPQLAAADSQIVISYAKQAGIPVLADPLSQGRLSHDDHVFAYYDTWLLTTLQEGSLFVSNSMPIRDIDTFLPTGTPLRLLANRGANGIDGILSSALGAATFDAKHRYLLVGDLAFIHDINGLMTAHQLPLTIILVNNAGGGIFSFLPQQQLEEAVFEPQFGTPQHLDSASLASGYGVTYQAIDSIAALRQTLAEVTNVTRILEVNTTRIENVQMHRSIWEVTNQALAEVFR
jgi:2-succinyl-5-enolpyruvyl-6-hydroxy-3-cyclohexene-1-carboxylate synthase